VRRYALLLGLVSTAAAVACSSTSNGTLQIVTGGETDTFTRAPAPVSLRVDEIDSSGSLKTLATASLPTDNIDLGSSDVTTIAALRVSGLDANGNRLVFGQSLPIELGALDGVTLPLFVQRTGELARMPNPLSDARPSPVLSLAAGRYLFVAGGSDSALAKTSQLYDFASLSPLSSPPGLPRAPLSVAFVGTLGWLIDGDGASLADLSSNTYNDVDPPAGGTFSEIAGGGTVVVPSDGSQYIVGATRTTGAPTDKVLALDPSGNPSWITLSAPRLGAAAAWVEGRGLVVAGGSATAAGVELVATKATTGTALAFLPDSSSGAGAIALDSQHVLLAGGVLAGGKDAGARAVDAGCGSACAPAVWTSLPVAITSAHAFAFDAATGLVVGSDASGKTHVYRLTTAAATEMPTKVTHTGAGAVVSPLGTIVLFGGAAEIESFTP
jgi:hypothetical protein